MKNFSKVLVFLLLFVVVTVVLSSTITAFAEDESNVVTYAETPDSNIAPPDVTHKIYNTCVTYTWTVGRGADKVRLSRVDYLWQGEYDKSYYEYAFPYGIGIGRIDCEPNYLYGQSYNSVQDTHSVETTSLEHLTYIDGVLHTVYSYNCNYAPTFVLPTATFPTALNIPTSYNQKKILLGTQQ